MDTKCSGQSHCWQKMLGKLKISLNLIPVAATNTTKGFLDGSGDCVYDCKSTVKAKSDEHEEEQK